MNSGFKLYTFLILISFFSSSFSINIETNSYVISPDVKDFQPSLNAINTTSSTEYFNETSFPRYNLVTRPLYLILYPHKGNPEIIGFDEEFKILVDADIATTNWEFYLKQETDTITLNIINSTFENNLWHFYVKSNINSEGLYDLQLNCSEGNDYQTHSVKILEEKTYPFNFLLISDSHFPSYNIYNTTDINLKLIQTLKQVDVEFAIFTGDLIEGASAQMFVDPETGHSLAARIQVKLGLWALDLLNMPVFIIAGNHDLDSSKPLPDDPPVVWKEFFGEYPILSFDYIDWNFIGYSVTSTGLSETNLNDVKTILDEKSRSPNVLFYHSNYLNQATNLRNSYNLEVMLYGHEHNYELNVIKNTLYFCQSAMFYNDSTIFTVLNSTAILLNGTEYDFTPLLIYTETPTKSASIIFLISLQSFAVLAIISRKNISKKFLS